MKRIIVPGLPHHIVQRGLKGRQTFLSEHDYVVYLDILAECCRHNDVEIWAYCLMPDHVHLIAIPGKMESMGICLQEVHDRYTRYLNRRLGSSEQFWQEQYASHLLDEQYLIACARYIEINPVKREYVQHPEDWPWSSARAHTIGSDDLLVQVRPLLTRVQRVWQDFLAETRPPEEADLFYQHEKSGLPLGSEDFLAMVEKNNPA